MDKSPTRITLVLAVGGLLGLLAAPLGCAGPPPKQEADGSKPSGPVPRPATKVDAKQPNATLLPNATLFKNVKVFDGKSDKLTASTPVAAQGD